tara:strand:+ start:142 stop:810 length:669 start_codon:yes stop_codon:yes gene_type:complete
MKFSDVAEKEYQKTLEEPDKSSSADRYLRPNKIDNNQEVEFIFLEEDPLEYWQAFGESIQDESALPFRFPITDQPPSNEEILTAMGGAYKRSKCQFDNEKQGLIKGKSDSPAVHCYVWPVFNLDKNCIQIFEVSQPSISKQIMKETGLKKYRKGVGLDSVFSCTLHKLIDGFTKYTFNIIDREEDEDKDAKIADEWEDAKKAGFDIDQLVLGGDPFNPEGDS